jgi:SAM-dependent methyltransferase
LPAPERYETYKLSFRVSTASPLPTPELAARIGGEYDQYRAIGLSHSIRIKSLLPAGWSLENKVVLDFGCGTGRTLSAFAAEARHGEFVGCDIHAESIAWAGAHLSPPFEFFLCDESPPLEQPDERFDLVYAMSVFTHITSEWSSWLAELHRVMRPGALAVITVLGPAMIQPVLGNPWDDRIGMATIDLDMDWDHGGPNALLAEWWVREHWGRAFEILRYEPGEPGTGHHDYVLLQRREVSITPAELARVDPSDPRELAAEEYNRELLAREIPTDPPTREPAFGALEADHRITRVIRRSAAAVRGLSRRRGR